MLRRSRAEDGFGLVEAVVAGGLLLVAIVGGIGVFDSSRRESASGERQQLAALQAQAEVERLRDVPYAELAINPASAEQWQSSGGPGDPSDRVAYGATATFRTGGDETEDLVYAAADGEGIAAQTTMTVPSGDANVELDVYRFVSWRDEECPVADLSGMSLFGLFNDAIATVDSILGSGSSLNALLGPLWGLLNTVIRNRLATADALLDDLDAELAELGVAVEGIEEIDPCDADVESLSQAEDALSTLEPVLANVDARLNSYRAGCTLFLCPGTGSALWTSLNSAITSLDDGDFETVLAELTASLNEIDASDTTHNTKRVTVAVVLEPRKGSGPEKPVWATSVVSDPDAGLLTGP